MGRTKREDLDGSAKLRKRENFDRLSRNRLDNALNDIRLIGNLANRNNYEYDEERVKEIFFYLEREVAYAKSRFFG